ncbi:MAG: spermine synthase [Nostocales cyanobacterium]|nr:MAG: spermine synthase [Nostocales cyanobacterium]
MNISLFVEKYDHGIAFYINGDLQFDSADEAIYHEHLVIPALGLAKQRFPNTQLKVLICGGGDGLAARDVLRFSEVEKIDLVDYSPEVLELANTAFKPYNLGSLENEKVNVYAQEAFAFVKELADHSYHVIICDFTCPKSATEANIYSQEWFQAVNRVLIPTGVVAVNGVSPDYDTSAFWCLYQTLLSVNFSTKPLQIKIPSFYDHDYGDWGFFLCSDVKITREEIETLEIPDNLKYLNQDNLKRVFQIHQKIAAYRHQVTIHTVENQQLFYYLLNYPGNQKSTDSIDLEINHHEYLDFLDIDETVNYQNENINSFNLESVAKFWLENIYATPETEKELPDMQRLVPVRHPYHEPKMTTSWLHHLQNLLSELDAKQLINSLLARAQELPPQIARELKILADKIKSNQPLEKLNPKMVEFMTLLSITMLMANLVAPDSVFAKGSYYRGSSTNTSSSSSGSGIDIGWKGFGFMLTIFGGVWLYSIINRLPDND